MRQLLQLLSHHERGHEDSVLTVSNGSEQQRQSAFTRKADVTRFYFFTDLTYKPPVPFACIDCRSCCLSFVSRTSPFDRVSAARELRFPQMDQLDIRQSRN